MGSTQGEMNDKMPNANAVRIFTLSKAFPYKFIKSVTKYELFDEETNVAGNKKAALNLCSLSAAYRWYPEIVIR